MKLKQFLKRNLQFLFVAAGYGTICFFTNITCPFKEILNFPCTTCGVTRALVALIRLDISGYLKNNAMALFLFVAVFLMLNIDFFEKRKIIYFYVFSVLMINFIYYLFRITIFVNEQCLILMQTKI